MEDLILRKETSDPAQNRQTTKEKHKRPREKLFKGEKEAV